MAHHKDLTGADLHEPKGVASASADTVYVADGSGSGAWSALPGSFVTVTRTIADISTAGDVYIGLPVVGEIDYIIGVLEAAITVADANVTFSIGGVAVDTSALVVAFTGSTPGAQFNSTPTGHNATTATSVLKISTDGASTTTAPFTVTVRIRVT